MFSMRGILLFLAVLASFCVPWALAVQAKEIRTIPSGEWTIVADADDETNKFADCYASTVYADDIVMVVMVDRNYTWGLAFGGKSWDLKLRSKIPLKFRIDQSPWFDAAAVVVAKDMVYLPMAQETTLLELFRHGRVLQLYDGGTFNFDLTGTARLMIDLAACVGLSLAAETGGARPSSAASHEEASSDAGETESSSGSGIVISEAGYILTNDHVIDGCRDVWVRRNGDIGRSASIVARDTTNDLALLLVDGQIPALEVATFRTGAPVRAGDSVAAYGFPLAGTLSSSGNVVSGNITAVTGVGDDVRYFQISAPIQPGNSGGPLLDFSGLVVGIVNAKLNELAWARSTGDLPQNVNFAIKENVILSFLEAHSIAYRSSPAQEKLDLPTVTDRAQRFTAYVACVH
jgi:S1-C subfamily serine protease